MHGVASRRWNWKPGYALIWTNAAAARLILEVGPHLRVKGTQARELVRFQSHLRACRRRRDQLGRLLPLSPRQREIREAFHRRLKSLNRRGPTIPHSRGAVSRRRVSQKVSAEYLAGFTDAEGSLILAKVRIVDKWNLQYVPRVCIDNTDKAVLEDCNVTMVGFSPTRLREKLDGSEHTSWSGTGARLSPFCSRSCYISELSEYRHGFSCNLSGTGSGPIRGEWGGVSDGCLRE